MYMTGTSIDAPLYGILYFLHGYRMKGIDLQKCNNIETGSKEEQRSISPPPDEWVIIGRFELCKMRGIVCILPQGQTGIKAFHFPDQQLTVSFVKWQNSLYLPVLVISHACRADSQGVLVFLPIVLLQLKLYYY